MYNHCNEDNCSNWNLKMEMFFENVTNRSTVLIKKN